MNYKIKYLVIFVIVFSLCFIFSNIAPSAFEKDMQLPLIVTVISYFLYGFTFAFLSFLAWFMHLFGIEKFLVENRIILFSVGLAFYALVGWLIGFIIQYISSLFKKQTTK